jgi:hypothetical protein
VLRRLSSLALVYAVVVASAAATRPVAAPDGWSAGETAVTHPALRRLHRPEARLLRSDGLAAPLLAILPPRVDLPPPAPWRLAPPSPVTSLPPAPAAAPRRARAPPVPA